MDVNLLKKIDDSYLAVILTLVVIGLLFILKTHEDKFKEGNKKVTKAENNMITFVE
ncbi:hypothetical protein [Flavicella sediminum]|uniref:hypothetical protein n=1 Tax=Flavicella sediminum TaxID=2585141 RepID=UPI00140921D1|nr:hypothetical protein [Flavicella sediminum]